MLSKTLQDGLSAYRVGEKLRALRLKKKMGLVELGRHTALSPAMLSKIERGRLFPTLPTLLRVSLVFGVGLEFFFAGSRDEPMVAVVRKSDRVQLPDQPGTRDVAYVFQSLDYAATERRFNCYLAEFLPLSPEKMRPHQHPGVEFIHIVRGRLGLRIGDTEHRLGVGDSVYFDAATPHAYRRAGNGACAAVVVTAL